MVAYDIDVAQSWDAYAHATNSFSGDEQQKQPQQSTSAADFSLRLSEPMSPCLDKGDSDADWWVLWSIHVHARSCFSAAN